MIYELESANAEKIFPLFDCLDYNLSIASIIAGSTPGRVFVDHPENPKAGLIFFGHHLFAAGSTTDRQFWKNLGCLVRESILPEAFGPGDLLMLHMPSQEWDERAAVILPELYPVQRERKVFECTRLVQPWQELLPSGFTLQVIDQKLLLQGLDHTDYLLEELCSERPSVEDFLQKSFGFCVLTGRELAGWCLSEYNTGDRCEVGVATVEKYQRRGLGTAATLALVEHALSHGIRRIGWHCWSTNLASVALAQRAGFDLLQDYKVHLCVLDLAVQFGLHAGDHHKAGDWDEQLLVGIRKLSIREAHPLGSMPVMLAARRAWVKMKLR
jgi:RimJ/RimL family protein N-acetyltransferase